MAQTATTVAGLSHAVSSLDLSNPVVRPMLVRGRHDLWRRKN